MADLASTDVTVTCNQPDRNCAGAGAYKDFVMATLAFGDGALTYPSGGVPLPAIGNFGFHKEIELGLIEQAPGNGFVYKYDRANHKIRIYSQGVRTGSTTVSTSSNGALLENSLAAETAFRAYGTAVDTNYDLGAMQELGNIAVAAVTLKMLLIGS